MHTFSLALRNVFRQKRRTALLAAALGVGVLIITVLESFTAGMAASLTEKVGRLRGGELFVSGTAASPSGSEISLIRDPDGIVRIAEEAGIRYTALARRASAQVRLVVGNREVSLGLEGLSERTEDLSGLDLASGSLDLPEGGGFLLLPADTAERLQVQAGEQVIVKISTVTGQENIGDLVVAGIFRQEFSLGQAQGYIDIEDLNVLLNLPAGSVQSLSFRLEEAGRQDEFKTVLDAALTARGLVQPETDSGFGGMSGFSDPEALMAESSGGATDTANSATAANTENATSPTATGGNPQSSLRGLGRGGMGGMRAMAGAFGGSAMGGLFGRRSTGTVAPDYVNLNVSDLNDITAQVSQLSDTMNLIGTALFLVLIAIALLGLSSTFRMVMLERTSEIGTLRALGMRRKGVLSMFLAEALCVTLLGAVGGTLLGLLIQPLLSLFHFASSGPLQLFLRAGRLSFAVEPGKLVLNIILLLAAGALAVFPQAFKASRLNPAAALAKNQ